MRKLNHECLYNYKIIKNKNIIKPLNEYLNKIEKEIKEILDNVYIEGKIML